MRLLVTGGRTGCLGRHAATAGDGASPHERLVRALTTRLRGAGEFL